MNDGKVRLLHIIIIIIMYKIITKKKIVICNKSKIK